MDILTATEQAYKNGYEKGYKDGVADASPGFGFWKWTPEGDRVCSKCGMLEPDCLPGACVIWPEEKRYCFKCGTRLIYLEEQ